MKCCTFGVLELFPRIFCSIKNGTLLNDRSYGGCRRYCCLLSWSDACNILFVVMAIRCCGACLATLLAVVVA